MDVRTGGTVDAILRAAEDHDVDLIEVGDHDKSLLDRLFDPSVSRGVRRRSRRPVLVVR